MLCVGEHVTIGYPKIKGGEPMTQANSSAPDLTLDELSEQIELWRQTRKTRRPMPEHLWQAAASLSKKSSLQKVSKALRLNYAALKKRVHPDEKDLRVSNQMPAAFIELGFSQQPPPTSECIVEMQDSCGAKIRMHFRGKTDLDLLELGKAFWRKGL
jgi:hypothetical protein